MSWKITSTPPPPRKKTLVVLAILSIIYTLNKYLKFSSDKLPFTSALTGMSEFNHFSTRGLRSQLKF